MRTHAHTHTRAHTYTHTYTHRSLLEWGTRFAPSVAFQGHSVG